jgi:hypothetical protein
MREFPGVKFVEMGRILGERWRALQPHEKKRFEEMAAEDKVRFQMEMQQYAANQAAAAPPVTHMPPQYQQHYQDPHALAAMGHQPYPGQYEHHAYAQQQHDPHQYHQA